MLGDRLGQLRRGKGLTQKQLADLLFVSVNTISAYERGINTPDDPTKIWLANFFDVSMDYLMGLSDKPDCSSPLLLYVDNLPPAAAKDLHKFLTALKLKYHL